MKGIVRNRGEGERRWFFGGGLHEWKATAVETGGSLFVFEDAIDAGKVTPLHLHPEADEAGYILEGEVELHLDGEVFRVGEGGFYFTPRGTPHAFRGIAPHTRLFALQTPGAGDEFYLRASEVVPAGVADGAVDFAAVGSAAKATGTTVLLGPPPFEVADRT
ncbi:MAG TPA: cupin domain-containing protein [Acidimicrobiales bacterium]|nr:cupin domain-containing protein [Acidimicrobiales bacterium]